MATSKKNFDKAPKRSPRAKPATSEKPYHLTPSEIESLRRDLGRAVDQLMKD